MAAEANKPADPPKKIGGWIVLILVAVLAGGSGFAVPRFLAQDTPKKSGPEKDSRKPAVIPFGDAVVNLGEERLTRYLRVKIILVVDGSQEKSITDHLAK